MHAPAAGVQQARTGCNMHLLRISCIAPEKDRAGRAGAPARLPGDDWEE